MLKISANLVAPRPWRSGKVFRLSGNRRCAILEETLQNGAELLLATTWESQVHVKLFWIRGPERDKGFVVRDRGGNAVEFEEQVNAWLMQNPSVQIEHIKQSACGGSWGPSLWLVSVWYTDKSGG